MAKKAETQEAKATKERSYTSKDGGYVDVPVRVQIDADDAAQFSEAGIRIKSAVIDHIALCVCDEDGSLNFGDLTSSDLLEHSLVELAEKADEYKATALRKKLEKQLANITAKLEELG